MNFPEILPRDEHNEELQSNVHPRDWTNPEPKSRYDLVVIGAGTAGLICASGAAALGADVALIERRWMGGDCLNVGCVPSKAILRSAHAAGEVRRAARFGVKVTGEVEVEFAAVMERMRELRSRISKVDSTARYRDELGVDVFLGDAAFSGNDSVTVDGKVLKFKKAVIATGGRPIEAPIPGLAEAGYLTNESVFSLTELPKRLLVVGGGPIGCELAQAFRGFGSEVTLVEMAPQFLGREDADAARILLETFTRQGIDVRLETTVSKVEIEGGQRRVTLERGAESDTLAVDAILLGIGRRPNIEGLGLEKVGVETDRAGVVVDDRFRTTNKKIFAAGDICFPYKFTHAAEFCARAVVQNALFFGRKGVARQGIPWVTYTAPEIAHVGYYEHEAREQGLEVDTYTHEFADVDRAIAEGEEEGFVKIHVEKGTDKIVGATIVARNAGDMISEVSVAMSAGVGLGKLATVIHPYPTQADAIRQCANAYVRTRLTPLAARLLKFIAKL